MVKACRKASKSLIRDFGEVEKLHVSPKGPGDFVTASDKRVEKIIIDELIKAKPDWSFVAEEENNIISKSTNNRFIIDRNILVIPIIRHKPPDLLWRYF